ncbi:UpxY family transcription antiterminator [Membranihabitans marinus]|uniref:UpxY family transcription antiterminator n=1 Tax=Membranihabitans marinus TaxID=1227546 RepID=UPI001F027203|nr:UpxY family transcription antiterminator [Membranihabitans marinus]
MSRLPISHINHLSNTCCKWFAVRTKYKTEKYIVDQLQKKGIEAYLPLQTLSRQYGQKRRMIQQPLIHQYVFVHIDRQSYLKVLQTNYVLGFLKNGKDLISIPEAEINTLKRIAGDLLPVKVEELSLLPGKKVEVIGGSLTGVQGILMEQVNKKYFTVQLHSMGMQLNIDIDKNLLRPLYPQ